MRRDVSLVASRDLWRSDFYLAVSTTMSFAIRDLQVARTDR
jgi:hypothetical protein